MTYFLNQKRRDQLTEALSKVGMTEENIGHFINLEDDLDIVDHSMYAHVMSINHFKAKYDNGEGDQYQIEFMKGVAILAALVREAADRGYGETDFPRSLEAIQETILEHKRKFN